MQVREVLQKVLESFGPNGEHWVQRHGVFDAPKCCIGTAFRRLEVKLDDVTRDEAWTELAKAAGADGFFGLIYWNDAPKRTWPEVKALFEKAIESAPGTDRYEVRG